MKMPKLFHNALMSAFFGPATKINPDIVIELSKAKDRPLVDLLHPHAAIKHVCVGFFVKYRNPPRGGTGSYTVIRRYAPHRAMFLAMASTPREAWELAFRRRAKELGAGEARISELMAYAAKVTAQRRNTASLREQLARDYSDWGEFERYNVADCRGDDLAHVWNNRPSVQTTNSDEAYLADYAALQTNQSRVEVTRRELKAEIAMSYYGKASDFSLTEAERYQAYVQYLRYS